MCICYCTFLKYLLWLVREQEQFVKLIFELVILIKQLKQQQLILIIKLIQQQ